MSAEPPVRAAADLLCALDLDRTLIYSRAAIEADGRPAGPLVCVERYRDADASFVTAGAARELAELCRRAVVVPATTRTVEQYRRVTLPVPPPAWAIAANGGVLLADGEPDAGWTRTVAARLAGVAPAAEVHAHAVGAAREVFTRSVRQVGALFSYAVLDLPAVPPGFVETERDWAAARGWRVSLQGRKLYWVPQPLSKSAAAAEVARRAGTCSLLAAGDSLLDADLLEAADLGVVARHGELVAAGWSAPHVGVTAARGIAAGEEIVRRLLSAASRRAPAHPAPPRPARTARG